MHSCTAQFYTSIAASAEKKDEPAHLQGRGILPSLTVIEPPAPDSDGSFKLDFKRHMPSYKAQRKFAVKNNGAIAATGNFDMDAHAMFTLLEGSQVFTLQPNENHVLVLEYHPTTTGKHHHSAVLSVSQNDFESMRIALAGECYQEDVTFVGTLGDDSDVVQLPDCAIGKVEQVDIGVRNHSGKHFRLSWPAHANLVFSPAALHLHAHSTADVLLTFTSSSTVSLAPADVAVVVSEIQFPGGIVPSEPWFAGSPKSSCVARAPDAPPLSEPKVEIVKGSDKKLRLKVFAVADDCKYECATREVNFKATPMFQTRAFSFPVKNRGATKLEFSTEVLQPDGTLDSSQLFSLTPDTAVVAAGVECVITVRFSPIEVQDCRRQVVFHLNGQQKGAELLVIELNGKVLRPWCHFEVRTAPLNMPVQAALQCPPECTE
jgi:hydrocephalus-inducing protein